jgi:GNAT superfamily N-acetyltransferase
VNVTVRRESLDSFLPEALPLLRKHYNEVSDYKDIPFDLDVEAYQSIENAGHLRIFTARTEDRLIGYSIYLVAADSHAKGSRAANQDAVFVDHGCRRSGAGLRLMRDAEMLLRGEGVQVIYQHVPAAHPALGVICARLGYRTVHTVYAKRLDREVR